MGDFGGGGVGVRGGLSGVKYPGVFTRGGGGERDSRSGGFEGRRRSNKFLQFEGNNLPLCGEKERERDSTNVSVMV